MKRGERTAWIAVTAFVAVFAGGLALSPNLLFADQSGADSQYYVNRLQYAFDFILNNYVDRVPAEQLYEGAMKGLFDSLEDPYSYYLTGSDIKDLTDTTTGRFGGVGLYISRPISARQADGDEDEPEAAPRDDRAKYIKVVAPIEDTPADRAGIHAGDYIIKVEDESTADLTVDDVVDRLRGTPGSDVEVTILRGKNITFNVTITRAIIEVPTVKHDMIDGEIGYLRIIQFTPYTDDRVREAISEFERQGYSSLVIDVRGNPGGLLTAVTDTVDFFFPSGVIVSTKSRIPQENDLFIADPSILVPTDLPVVVLIDEGSASASEILAGAFKDTDRGLLIGETSFGKGSVQKIIPFGESGFKLTISRYYTPSDVNIDKVGITPDIVVKEEELSEEDGESLQKIFENSYIKNFVDQNPNASEAEKARFVRSLQREKNIDLDTILLRRLLKNEYHRRMDFPPVYDLEFDKALKDAIQRIRRDEVQANFTPYTSPGKKRGEVRAKI